MASKLARQIGALLLAHDYLSILGTTGAIEVIDRVLQGRTISKKEVARLQDSERILSSAIDANNDLLRAKQDLRTEISGWKQVVNDLAHDLISERKNSQQTQEALTISIENYNQLRKDFNSVATALLVRIVNDFSQKATGQDAIVNKEPEYIIPPPCLKPNDAITWSNNQVEAQWKDPNATL